MNLLNLKFFLKRWLAMVTLFLVFFGTLLLGLFGYAMLNDGRRMLGACVFVVFAVAVGLISALLEWISL